MNNLAAVGFISALHRELHDMVQPIAVLQCRLEIGQMPGAQTSATEIVDEALGDVQKLITSISRMREILESVEEGQ